MVARWSPIAIILVAILAVAGAAVAANWTPSVPTDAGSEALGQATLSGPVLPDPDPNTASQQFQPSPAGQACLDRITRPAGWLDLCWQAGRVSDFDPGKDYYVLRVYGTVSGSGTGMRWNVLRAQMLGQVADSVYDFWPDGVFDGPCRSVPVDLMGALTISADETICGRTVGANDGRPVGHQVTWTCVGCILPDHSERSVSLYSSVAVAQGSVPVWSIGADFGD